MDEPGGDDASAAAAAEFMEKHRSWSTSSRRSPPTLHGHGHEERSHARAQTRHTGQA